MFLFSLQSATSPGASNDGLTKQQLELIQQIMQQTQQQQQTPTQQQQTTATSGGQKTSSKATVKPSNSPSATPSATNSSGNASSRSSPKPKVWSQVSLLKDKFCFKFFVKWNYRMSFEKSGWCSFRQSQFQL